MSVGNTAANKKVALYDDTTDVAFGPVFDSEGECDDFLVYLVGRHNVDDPREQTDAWLIEKYEEWQEYQAWEKLWLERYHEQGEQDASTR